MNAMKMADKSQEKQSFFTTPGLLSEKRSNFDQSCRQIQLSSIDPRSYVKSSSEKRVVLSINDLSLLTPDHEHVLISSLNISLSEGQNLLIVGNSGIGKSSLLRAIAVSTLCVFELA